jgi:tryptophan synthase alpha chain
MTENYGAEAITAAIELANGPAICAYITAGYPTLDLFPSILESVAQAADVVEIGVPFTDPMADGLTIQHSSRVALENGVDLGWILELLASKDVAAPHLLMGYYNPFLAFGFDRLGPALTDAGCSGLIVPDLPFEESAPMHEVLDPAGLALVQLVTPTTSAERLRHVADAGGGFLYAVTTTGVTGGESQLAAEILAYLDRVSEMSDLPVLAGFGVRSQEQVMSLAPHVDGVIVGSALIEAIDRGDDPGAFLDGLRAAGVLA